MNQTEALKILKTGVNVFLTGEPGSGKTYTVNTYVKYLRSHGIEPAITASTGIAATHLGGMTIHSWSGIGIRGRLGRADLRNIATNAYVKKRVSKAHVLIIDEISMLTPETLQMVESVCREVKQNTKPFGGIQVVLVGDFFQLPPVVKSGVSDDNQENLFEEIPIRFAYDSYVWQQAEFVTCYLTEQHRQDDEELLYLLSKIRNNSFDGSALNLVEQRKVNLGDVPANAPKLYTHNADVDATNNQMLAKIPGEAQFFPMNTKGHEALIQVMKKGCLSPDSLYLKTGASVMFTKNNIKEGFVNGTLGEVEGFDAESELPIVKIRNGRRVKVEYADWIVEEDGKTKGKLSQLPLRLAWAITVHKSQGISLDEAVVDLSRVFEFGQGYVALSRVRRLLGLYILGWNDAAFKVDEDVLLKDKKFREQSLQAEKLFSRFSEAEMKNMVEDFIVHCGGEKNVADVAPKSKKKLSTNDETLKLWQSGKNIQEIAETRGLSEKTILGHIGHLVEGGYLERTELARAASPELLKAIPDIQAAFQKLKTTKLTPVFKHFRSMYSYDELIIARTMMADQEGDG